MQKKIVISCIIFIVIFILHFILQFVAWSYAPGNTAFKQTNFFAKIAWPVLSFPVIWLAPKDGSNLYFWLIFGSNSFIWGMLGTALVLFIKKVR